MGRLESFSMIYCGTDSPEETFALPCCLQLLPSSSTLTWQIHQVTDELQLCVAARAFVLPLWKAVTQTCPQPVLLY